MGYVQRRIRRGQGVPAPSEDSLSQHQTRLLNRADYSYADGRWRPPGHHGAPLGDSPSAPAKNPKKSAMRRMIRKES
jgi:hypothetical protein